MHAGANGSGQLGDGTTSFRNFPVLSLSDHTYASIAAGGAHTCGLMAGGSLECWGAPAFWSYNLLMFAQFLEIIMLLFVCRGQ